MNLNQWEKVKTAFSSSDHGFKTTLYLLLVFLLPTQLGRHFWFSFSYLHGIRVDYLSPTLYVTDILLILLLGLFLLQSKSYRFPPCFLTRSLRFFSFDLRVWQLMLLLIGLVFLNTLFSQSPLLTLYGFLKWSEFGFFGWYTYAFCKNEARREVCLGAFLLGVTLQAILALLQYYHGGSLGGLWYFLGERFYSGTTPGIANASLFGQLVLRPYGTLPHPNVLAAYLLMGLFFLLFTPLSFLPKRVALSSRISLAILFLGSLGVTLSRTALVLLIPLFLFFFLKRTKKQQAVMLTLVIMSGVLLLFPFVLERFVGLSITDQSVISRESYIRTSLEIIRRYPISGTGLFAYLPTLSKTFPETSYDFLQPVHSVFLLLIAELGVPIGMLLLSFCGAGVYQLVKKRQDVALFLLFILCFLGLFDHYFWTLQQGQFLLSFCIAQVMVLGINVAKKPRKRTLLDADKRKI